MACRQGMPVKLPIYRVSAFTRDVFAGNPAAVCPLEQWLDDELLQAIATENNLSETAFIVPGDNGWRLRWFTPATEVDLCGHATLASAWVVTRYLDPSARQVQFLTHSGPLAVRVDGDLLRMDFPAQPAVPLESPPAALQEGLGCTPRFTGVAEYYLAVLDNASEVRALQPDFAVLAKLDRIGVIVTAPGWDVDFVSRFFAPAAGVPEDPVTGSAHCTLIPYWSGRLGKTSLVARQISARAGDLLCQDRGERVEIAGHAVLYFEGEVSVPG